MRALNLVGQRFGKLLVVESANKSKNGSVLWKCLCDCTNISFVTSRHLNRKNNNVRSCGCDRVKRGSQNSSWKGYEELSGHWWSSHLKHAKNCKQRPHIELRMSKEEAWEVFLSQHKKCFFTGVELIIDNSTTLNTASIDRIDNSKDYVKENIRWVHKSINMMKRVMNDEDFVSMCSLVAKNMSCPVR